MHLLLLTSLDDSLTFGSAEWLWALCLLFPIGWFFFQAGRKREELISKILAPRLQQQLVGRVSPLKRNLRMGLLLLSLVCIILAAAQPRYGYAQQEIKSKGRDVIIAIDTSRSMLSTDTAPTRLGRAKLIAQDLLNLLKGDRVGLVAFAGTAFLQAPLTLDKGAVLTSIQDLDTNTIPKGGTDIATAIQMAIAAFGKGEGTSRVLVLMTDGEELDASGVEAAKEAAALGIKIFTIGFGSAEGSLIPIKTESGQNDFVRDDQGNPVNSKLDADRLKEIAKTTGGFYQSFGQDAAKVIYDQGIVPIEEQENGVLSARKPIERYAWPAGVALSALMLWSVLGEGRRNKMSMVVIAAGLVFSPISIHASGISDYSQGNYQGALKDFEERMKTGTVATQVIFDAGAAAYKLGDYKKAASYFSQAMTSSDPKIRDAATYNLANSLVRTGEAAKENDAKISDWKNSLQHYETVLKSTPKNTQAIENRDIVKKLIEDLKKQQDQKKQQDKKNDQKKDQKDKDKDQQKNDQSQGEGKSDQQKNQDQKNQQNQKDQKDSQGGKNSKDQNQNSKNQDQKNPQQQPTPQNAQQDPKNQQDQKGESSPTPSPSPDQGKNSDSEKKDQQKSDQQSGQQNQSQPENQGKDQKPGEGAMPTPVPTPTEKKEGPLEGGEKGQKPDEKSQEQKAAEASEAEEGKDGKMTPNQARTLLRSVQDEEQHVLDQQQRAVEQTSRDW